MEPRTKSDKYLNAASKRGSQLWIDALAGGRFTEGHDAEGYGILAIKEGLRLDVNEGIKCLRSKCDASSSMDFEHYQRHIPLLNRVVILFCWIFFVEEGIFFKGCPCILLVHVGCKGASRCLEERKGGGGGGLSMCSWPSVACGSAEKAASGTANSWILHEGKKQVKTVIQRQKDVTLLSYLTERESKIACITSMFQCPLGRVLCRMSMKLTKLKYTVTNHMHPSL